MRASLLVAAIASTSLCACTTVDMTQLGSGAAPVASVQDTGANVVEKATSRLFALFSSKGWSTLQSRKKMQSAASVLLNGLDDKRLSDDPSPYLLDATTLAQLSDDVREADYHIGQTVKAADIFLAMSAPDDDIREELSELEQALLASRQAERVFTAASEKLGEPTDLASLTRTVDRLRDVTDEFGRRVRRTDTRKVAARTVSADS